jgi:prepilin-type N-terminal cleavage/methylation domain-containing protein
MKRSGFTLIEVLTAVLLSAVACSVALMLMRHAALVIGHMSNRATAWERGQNALSIIDPRVLHASFGITYERAGDVFRRSFGKNEMASPPPARWTDRGPLQIWDGDHMLSLAPEYEGVFRGRGIAILYAMPSALRASTAGDAPVTLSQGEAAKIRLVPNEELIDITSRLPTTARNDLRSWVTFPLMRLPVYASYSAGELTVRMADGSGLSATLYPYDEMHYIRGARFYVQNGIMYSEELRTLWTQVETRLEGVLEMWFEWTPSKKFLEAWILTTGAGQNFSASLGGRPKDWPAEAPWRPNFELHDVVVVKGSWLLKNM